MTYLQIPIPKPPPTTQIRWSIYIQLHKRVRWTLVCHCYSEFDMMSMLKSERSKVAVGTRFRVEEVTVIRRIVIER